MARYRKIDPRIWGDERFATFSITQKLAWIGLLTHPTMTPMGAGIFPSSLLDSLLDYDGSCICPLCFEESNRVGSSDAILEGFKEASLILRDNDLVIVKNFLVYNRPDNPNQLSGWIEWCEELPRSSIFAALEEYLHDTLEGHPPWLFAGLLKPLSEQRNKTLKARYWDRISEYVDRPQGRIKKGTKEGIKEPSKVVRTNQEQELEQELEQDKESSKEKPSSENSYSSKKGRKIKGDKLTWYEEFWTAFDYRKGKASAADSWLDIKNLNRELVDAIVDGAKKEVIRRKTLREDQTAIMAQGWLSARRWEDDYSAMPSGTNRALTRGAEEFADVFEEA